MPLWNDTIEDVFRQAGFEVDDLIARENAQRIYDIASANRDEPEISPSWSRFERLVADWPIKWHGATTLAAQDAKHDFAAAWDGLQEAVFAYLIRFREKEESRLLLMDEQEKLIADLRQTLSAKTSASAEKALEKIEHHDSEHGHGHGHETKKSYRNWYLFGAWLLAVLVAIIVFWLYLDKSKELGNEILRLEGVEKVLRVENDKEKDKVRNLYQGLNKVALGTGVSWNSFQESPDTAANRIIAACTDLGEVRKPGQSLSELGPKIWAFGDTYQNLVGGKSCNSVCPAEAPHPYITQVSYPGTDVVFTKTKCEWRDPKKP